MLSLNGKGDDFITQETKGHGLVAWVDGYISDFKRQHCN